MIYFIQLWSLKTVKFVFCPMFVAFVLQHKPVTYYNNVFNISLIYSFTSLYTSINTYLICLTSVYLEHLFGLKMSYWFTFQPHPWKEICAPWWEIWGCSLWWGNLHTKPLELKCWHILSEQFHLLKFIPSDWLTWTISEN